MCVQYVRAFFSLQYRRRRPSSPYVVVVGVVIAGHTCRVSPLFLVFFFLRHLAGSVPVGRCFCLVLAWRTHSIPRGAEITYAVILL